MRVAKHDAATDWVIRARGLAKRFRSTATMPKTLKGRLFGILTATEEPCGYWAIRDVDVEVRRGESLGIVGHNGAGKSTLLRLLAGVGRPTRGTIERHGRLAGVLALATGFHGDLTGRESIVIGGILGGLTAAGARARIDEVVDFAELREVIDQPVRTYSTGMYVRLAFSTAVVSGPAVLVLDEILAVGDTTFQQKCLDRLESYRREGGTLIVASHVPEHLRVLCDRGLVLADGRSAFVGDTAAALDYHERLLTDRAEHGQGPTTAHGSSL
jgi:ABC-type polysaccharide/polyol phosphate transport system ATPase subunit